MLTIIWSLLLLIFFILSGAVVINYIFFTWENDKVNDLTKKIRPQHNENNILFKTSSSREFTTFDLNNLSKTKPVKAVHQAYDRALAVIGEVEYPTWKGFLTESRIFLKKSYRNSLSFARYLISLTKPAELEEKIDPKEDKKMREVEEVIDKVTELNKTNEPVMQEPEEAVEEYAIDLDEINAHTQKQFSGDMSQKSVATLGIANSSQVKSEIDMTLFERLESRILAKLKASGMGNYDIWLELGDLYLKFDEKEKAREVFALILKHAEGVPKELARDRLIGI